MIATTRAEKIAQLDKVELAVRKYLSGELEVGWAFGAAQSGYVDVGREIGDQISGLVGSMEDISAFAIDQRRPMTADELAEIRSNLIEALEIIDDIRTGRRSGLET